MTGGKIFEVQVVGAAIVDSLSKPTQILLGQRLGPPALAGKWEFPGGKVDEGECCEDALRRELAEELGVQCVLGAEIPGTYLQGWQLTERHVMRVWLAEIAGG